MDLPNNIFQVYELCKSKEKCIPLLKNVNILPKEKQCENGHKMLLSITNSRERWRCPKTECRKDIQLCSNTWLDFYTLKKETVSHLHLF